MSSVVSIRFAAAALLVAGAVAGCTGQTYSRGFVAPQNAVEQVPVGASREQVLVVLGTPSTTADFGNEVFYYISQKARRALAFQRTSIVDQRVIAVYFDSEGLVTRLADYGLKDGRVFDFVTNTTPTGGSDVSFVSQLLAAAGRPGI